MVTIKYEVKEVIKPVSTRPGKVALLVCPYDGETKLGETQVDFRSHVEKDIERRSSEGVAVFSNTYVNSWKESLAPLQRGIHEQLAIDTNKIS